MPDGDAIDHVITGVPAPGWWALHRAGGAGTPIYWREPVAVMALVETAGTREWIALVPGDGFELTQPAPTFERLERDDRRAHCTCSTSDPDAGDETFCRSCAGAIEA